MDYKRYLELVFENGISYGPRGGLFLTENYKTLKVSNQLKVLIENSFNSKSNFEIQISEFQNLKSALILKIRELINHTDFDPFKEELRARYPLQYSSNPFEFEGITYYLYSKGMPHNIDSNISGANSFIKLIESHEEANKALRFVYKEYN